MIYLFEHDDYDDNEQERSSYTYKIRKTLPYTFQYVNLSTWQFSLDIAIRESDCR